MRTLERTARWPERKYRHVVEPDPWGLGDDAARPLRALGAVLGDLADLRYDTRWIGIPASRVGAPRPRYRIFILAHRTVPHPSGLGRLPWRGNPRTSESMTRHDRTLSPGHRSDAERSGWLAEMEQRTGDAVEPD